MSAHQPTCCYTVDLNAGLSQVLADGTYTYLYGSSRLAQYGTSGAEYFLTDALGSVRQVVDAAGAVILSKDYRPPSILPRLMRQRLVVAFGSQELPGGRKRSGPTFTNPLPKQGFQG